MTGNGMVWPGSGRAPAPPAIEAGMGARDKEHAMSQTLNSSIAVHGVAIGKNSFNAGCACCNRAVPELVAQPDRSTMNVLKELGGSTRRWRVTTTR